MAEKTDGDGTSYRARLVFGYSISGLEYTSGQHTDGGEFPHTKQSVEQIVNRFPAGTTTYVAVNPTDPLDAVLDTGFPKIWQLLHRVGTVGAAVGIAIFVYQAAYTQ